MSDDIEKACREWVESRGLEGSARSLTALVREQVAKGNVGTTKSLVEARDRIAALEAALEKVRTNHWFKTHTDEDNCMSCDNLYDEIAALLAKTRTP